MNDFMNKPELSAGELAQSEGLLSGDDPLMVEAEKLAMRVDRRMLEKMRREKAERMADPFRAAIEGYRRGYW